MTGKEPHKPWSLAGSARFARDARIAAARYMRHAQAEQDWYAAMLAYGHQARTATSGDPDAARALQFATMGYAPPYPRDWDQASAQVLADEARYLAEADLYVLTPQMLDVVVAAAQTLTFADLGLLRADDLPSPSGVVILPRPLTTRLPTGTLQHNIAYAWRSPWRISLPQRMGYRGQQLPAVRMSSYTTSARASRDVARAARAQGFAVPPMLLDIIWSLPTHPTAPGQAHDQEHLTAALRRLNTGYWQEETRRTSAPDPDQATGEYASGGILDEDQDGTLGSRFLYAFWRLCEQQIATQQPAEPSHAARVTATRARVSQELRIITLRRASTPAQTAGQAGAHQWHHHWIVRMHKVRQWYPSLQQHKVLYRGPLIKGDTNKPLLSGEIVRGLIR